MDYIEDLEGLLTYLGEKIGIGHVCIYCNGKGRAAYPSTHAVRQHMVRWLLAHVRVHLVVGHSGRLIHYTHMF